jgi:hypothetical protein
MKSLARRLEELKIVAMLAFGGVVSSSSASVILCKLGCLIPLGGFVLIVGSRAPLRDRRDAVFLFVGVI